MNRGCALQFIVLAPYEVFFFIRERGREGEGIGGGVCKKKIDRAKIGIFSEVGFKLVCFI